MSYGTGNIGEYTLNLLPGNVSRHSGGSNFLAADGHVKFLSGGKVSGGYPAASPGSAEVYTSPYTAAGTGNMYLETGGPVTLTFSPM